MKKITANMRRLTITTQESGARLREPGKTLIPLGKKGSRNNGYSAVEAAAAVKNR